MGRVSQVRHVRVWLRSPGHKWEPVRRQRDGADGCVSKAKAEEIQMTKKNNKSPHLIPTHTTRDAG